MNTRVLVLSLALTVTVPVAAAPSLSPLAGFPVEQQAVVLQFQEGSAPAPGVLVTAVYRENAHASLRREQPIGMTDASGTVEWTPDAAGVVVLQWDGGSHNLSVVHDGIPTAGLWVAILAGLALIGGSVAFFLQMLRQPESELIEELETFGEPPST